MTVITVTAVRGECWTTLWGYSDIGHFSRGTVVHWPRPRNVGPYKFGPWTP